jgi:hypothetical protein
MTFTFTDGQQNTNPLVLSVIHGGPESGSQNSGGKAFSPLILAPDFWLLNSYPRKQVPPAFNNNIVLSDSSAFQGKNLPGSAGLVIASNNASLPELHG